MGLSHKRFAQDLVPIRIFDRKISILDQGRGSRARGSKCISNKPVPKVRDARPIRNTEERSDVALSHGLSRFNVVVVTLVLVVAVVDAATRFPVLLNGFVGSLVRPRPIPFETY